MEPIIKSHNGFIDKFIGDAIMALFPREEDAVESGKEMLIASRELKFPNGNDLEIGIGIHSGELILGTIGSESRIETTVIGDTVNLASRIESLNLLTIQIF
jgi:class 3 adenylate cyclase